MHFLLLGGSNLAHGIGILQLTFCCHLFARIWASQGDIQLPKGRCQPEDIGRVELATINEAPTLLCSHRPYRIQDLDMGGNQKAEREKASPIQLSGCPDVQVSNVNDTSWSPAERSEITHHIMAIIAMVSFLPWSRSKSSRQSLEPRMSDTHLYPVSLTTTSVPTAPQSCLGVKDASGAELSTTCSASSRRREFFVFRDDQAHLKEELQESKKFKLNLSLSKNQKSPQPVFRLRKKRSQHLQTYLPSCLKF